MRVINPNRKLNIFNPPPGIKIIIPVIKPELNRGMWDTIEGVVQDYTRLHPEEMRLFMAANKHARDTRLNQFGSSQSKSVRWGMSMPTGLDVLIKKYYPEVLSTKKTYTQFMRKFPGFRVCEVV